jgi:hypothetical protein
LVEAEQPPRHYCLPGIFKIVLRVFLQIGGNDIRKNTTYVDVFKGIRSVVDRLITGGVRHIIMGSILYRSKPRGITSDEYNSKPTC